MRAFLARERSRYYCCLQACLGCHTTSLYGCGALQWDASGELLAILPRGNSFAIVWTATTREIAQSEAGFKVATAGTAAVISPCLA